METKDTKAPDFLVRKEIHSYSVTHLNEAVRNRLHTSSGLRNLWLEGELFNLTKHGSGHIYFSLKDEQSQIRCTFFRRSNAHQQHLPLKNGNRVLIFGSVSVYLQRGEYQFNVQRVMMAGEGELRLKIEELKRRLAGEGLFDAERKKAFPYFPVTLGIATSGTGAAVKDIMSIALSRYPNLNIFLAPCKVQGEGAALSIISAVKLLQTPKLEVDVIIVGRGGGSFEDLLAFNDESVLRAIADCRLPIVSAVGHAIDSPLSDLAADAAAPTPTAAAELVIPDVQEWEEFIKESQVRMHFFLKARCQESRQRLSQAAQSPAYREPLSLLQERWQSIDNIKKQLQQKVGMVYEKACRCYERFSYLPKLFYEKNTAAYRQRYELLRERLQNFSPLLTLQRGYAVVRDKKKKSILSTKNIHINEELDILLAQGSFLATVKKIT